MIITFLTVFPDLVTHISRAAATIDPNHKLLELHFSNAVPHPSSDDLATLTSAIRRSDVVVLDGMGGDPAWLDAANTALEGYTGSVLCWGAEFIDKVRLGAFSMNAMEKDGVMGMAMGGMRKLASRMSRKHTRTNDSHAQESKGMPPARVIDRLGTTKHVRAGTMMGDAARFVQLGNAFHAMRAPQADFFLRHLLHHEGGHPEIVIPSPPKNPPRASVSIPGSGTYHSTVTAYSQTYGAPDGRPTVALIYSGLTYPYDSDDVVKALMDALATDCWIVPVNTVIGGGEPLEMLRKILEEAKPQLIISMLGFRIGGGPRGGDVEASTAMLESIGAPIMHPLMLSRLTEERWRASCDGLSPSESLVMLMLPEMDGCLAEIPIAAMSTPIRDDVTGVITSKMVPIPEQIDRFAARVRGQLRLPLIPSSDKRVAIIGYDYPAGESNLLGGAMLDTSASIAAIMAQMSQCGYQTQTPDASQILNDLLEQAVNSPSYIQSEEPTVYRRTDAERDLPAPQAWQRMDQTHSRQSDRPMTTVNGDFLIPAVEYGNVLVGVQPGRGPVATATTDAHDRTLPPHPQYAAFYTWLRQVWRPDAIVHVGTHGTLEFLQGKENAVSADCFPDLLIGDVPNVYIYYCGNAAEGLIARRRSHAVLVSHQPPLMRPTELDDDLTELDDMVAEYRRSLELMPQTSDELLQQVRERATALHMPTDLNELEIELTRTKKSLVPIGLHVWGQAYSPGEARSMVRAMVEHGCFDQSLTPSLSPAERAEIVDQALSPALVSRPSTTFNPDIRQLVTWARALHTDLQHNDEVDGLFRALDGRHVGARLGGDPIRDPQTLPSGHSLYQFDSRKVPTPLAMRRGREIADAVSAAYRTSHDGTDPQMIAVVLWGLETTRTQGETYAQIMSLLGARPTGVRRPGMPRWEIIPTDELTRPRVDVVVTICGFFRDLFPNLVNELDEVIATVAALDEPVKVNPLAARTRKQAQAMQENGESEDAISALAHARIFGPAPGQYGTGLTDVIEAGQWHTSEDLAAVFTAASGFVYTRENHGVEVADLYSSCLRDVDVVSQIRSSNEYEITDLDHYFEYLGGINTSVRTARGEEVPVLVTDTTQAQIQTTSAERAMARGLRTRLLNKDWTDSILAHGHRGVEEIGTRITNLVGLAATTGQTEDWMFDAVCERFINDTDMAQRLAELNPHAFADLTRRMLEAHGRGLWDTDDNQLHRLNDLFIRLDSDLEATTDETTVRDITFPS